MAWLEMQSQTIQFTMQTLIRTWVLCRGQHKRTSSRTAVLAQGLSVYGHRHSEGRRQMQEDVAEKKEKTEALMILMLVWYTCY